MLKFFLNTINCFKTSHVFIFIHPVTGRYWASLHGCFRWKNPCGTYECYFWLRAGDSFIPLNFPAELTITSLDNLFSCFRWNFNLFWLFSCVKCRALLCIDVYSPFSCTVLCLIITFNVIDSVPFGGWFPNVILSSIHVLTKPMCPTQPPWDMGGLWWEAEGKTLG